MFKNFLVKYEWLIVGLAILVSYIAGRSDGRDLQKADILEIQAKAENVEAAVQVSVAKALSTVEIKHVTIKQLLEKETRVVPVHNDCKHTVDGLRAVNAALTNKAVSSGDSELPEDASGAE